MSNSIKEALTIAGVGIEVKCQYCKKPAKLVKGSEIYSSDNFKHLHNDNYWICHNCYAYVGCHKDTDIPFGSLANKKLRGLRHEAHCLFDEKWKNDVKFSRGEAYKWLASKMNLTKKECHIGNFGERQCKYVIKLMLKEYWK